MLFFFSTITWILKKWHQSVSLHPMDCFHLMFFHDVFAIVILSCAPPPAAGSGGIANWCKLQIANRGNSWNQIIVFEDVFHFEVFDPCIILRSQNSESISPMGLTNSHWRLGRAKVLWSTSAFLPCLCCDEFWASRLGSGQWLSSRMFLQEESPAVLWPWEVRGKWWWYTPETSRNLYNVTKWS